jgi:hypothetical protein
MFYPRYFLTVKMAASRIRPLFEIFRRIFPQLFARVIRGTTETVVLDTFEKELKNLKQGIRPSKQKEEAIRTPNPNRDMKNNSNQEFHQREFTNVDHNSLQRTNF